MNITLRQLRAFQEVARTRSFTLAARNMNLTQSAVSMLVRQLEKEYGMELFDRVQRSAQLTEVGHHMLPVTERILDDLQQIEAGAEDMKALKRGTLRLAVPQMLACSWLPPITSEFLRRYPDITLHVTDTTGDRINSAVKDNEAEIGIGPQRTPASGIDADMLWEEPIQVVLPDRSPLAAARSIAWADLRDENWIQYSDDFTLYLERVTWKKGPIFGRQTANVRYLTTALAFVGSGMGVTAAPTYASFFEKQFSVKFRTVRDSGIMRKFYLYSRTDQYISPAARKFISFVKKNCGKVR